MLRFHVSNKRERQEFEHHVGPIEFGRGPKRDSTPRCVIQDLSVSRDHVRIEEPNNGLVRVENLSQKNPIRLQDNTIISPGTSRDLGLPIKLTIGETLIDVQPTLADIAVPRESLATVAPPVRGRRLTEAGSHSLLNLGGTPTPEVLTHWFETVIAVQRAAAGSPEFYDQTARALVDLVGLDRGLVLLRREDSWEVVARSVTESAAGREFSYTILKYVLEERRTFYQSSASASSTESLQGVEAVVASPIFDTQDRVVGVLYGSRTRYAKARGIGVGPLEAYVVQLLASAVGAGLARLEQEAGASRIRVQFEQFFTADLANELQRNPRLLEGQEREVTAMFSDIRGFSRIALRLGAHDSCRLVSDVMERLTARVRENEGVVVDYMGDGLLAMWNAPADQPDHASRGCRAAVSILNDVPALSAAWLGVVGHALQVGIGLNTGTALVGNTGSRQKFKYGPIGHTINLASRVESATKQLCIPALITGSTHEQLGDAFATRRLCRVRVVGMDSNVDLYELSAEGSSAEWTGRRDLYEKALEHFERKQWDETCATLYPLVTSRRGDHDIPCLDLLERAITCLKNPPEVFDPVIRFDQK